MTTHKQTTGKLGESLAVDYLQKNGYRIITTNWRCQWGEIDIIAHDGQEVVFIEVKTCHSANTESAFENMTPAKMRKFIRSAYTYADMNQILIWRIDAIAIALNRSSSPIIEHVQNAFTD
ncbi:MAG TPA: YraN family protein [Aggregatilineales bacterium]|nr:YraN family protein [Aggregatilineales bacterium]